MKPGPDDYAEQLSRDERAYERGEHEDRRVEREERLARLREWDIAIGEWIE